MKKIKMIHESGEQLFTEYDRLFCRPIIEVFLKVIPNTTKTDILELLEHCCLCMVASASRHESDEMIPYLISYDNDDIDSPNPTYISEYIGIVGNLFLAGHIDFLCDWDDEYKQTDYPTNLSYYGNSKYEAWVYFRDNFFYKKKFSRSYDEDRNNEEGYSVLYSCTSWDKPDDWSQYNILVALTPKGKQYLSETLAPKFYEKYKDVEIYLDDEGNITGSNADTAVKA